MPPNLLLVTVDTLRADRLDCYGGSPGVGSALCGLADRGVRYVWAFSPAPSTAPAIASILTSRYPSQHGVSQFAVTRLGDEAVTLTEALADAGYETAAIISNPVLAAPRNLDQGFDRYDVEMTRAEPNRPGFREREAASATAAALEWLRDADDPWFLWVHYQDPHGPYGPPGAAPISDQGSGPRLRALADHSGFQGIPAYQHLPGVHRLSAYEARYGEEVTYLDEQFARLLREVDSLPRPPAVLVTADHGEAFGEDDHWFSHGHSLALEQVRVPLLWRPPGGTTPSVVTRPVTTLDVAPSLLQAAGLAVPSRFLGVALPHRDGEGSEEGGGQRPLFFEHRLREGVVSGDLYYARDRPGLRRPVADRITGGWLQPLPARTARLAPTGQFPEYRPAEEEAAAASVVAELDRFVVRVRDRARGSAETTRMGADVEQQLEALGYLE